MALRSVPFVMGWDAWGFADVLLTQPLLIVVGEESANKWHADRLFKLLSGKNKGLKRVVWPNAYHIDFYDNLEAAFRGRDVIVSTVGMEAIPGQKLVIDAAIEAGVKRFIPSDFGALTTDSNASHFPHNLEMIDIQEYLHTKADAGLPEYTIFSIEALTEFIACNTAKSRFKVACRAGGVTHVVAASTTVLTYRISNDRSLPTP
ncbi:hypothetical protein IG631_18888 [Alternaria alternata]|nr:hypothetical protein IG631_18888 [Alternaria alternata]